MRVPSSPRLNPPFDGGRTGRQFSGAIFGRQEALRASHRADEYCSARGLSGCRLFGARHLAVGAGGVAVGLRRRICPPSCITFVANICIDKPL